MKQKMCHSCEGRYYRIYYCDCDECRHNGAYDEETKSYCHDQSAIDKEGLIRDQAETEGECQLGPSSGHGCVMFICACCNAVSNVPLVRP